MLLETPCLAVYNSLNIGEIIEDKQHSMISKGSDFETIRKEP